MSEGFCSWCFQQAVPTLVEGCTLERDLLKCSNCGKRIVKCRACGNYAKWDSIKVIVNDSEKRKTVRHQFCAEHHHEIPNFETANATLSNPAEYPAVYEYASPNLSRLSRIGGISLASAAALGPLALLVAPAVGGAIGVAMGYGGAVATKVGLATLGGGALAAGGAGMAGGTAAVVSVGTILGGGLGAFVGNAYLRSVKDFAIHEVRDGEQPALITISGFLSQKDESSSRWRAVADDRFPGRAWYHVDWSAKNLAELGKYTSAHMGTTVLTGILGAAATSASKLATRAIGPAATAYQVLQLSKNPWHVAMIQSEQTGIILADILRRCESSRFVLVGHSLGCRVIANCLQALATTGYEGVERVHLLGGAVGNDRAFWAQARKAVSGPIVNYTSENDGVLKTLYKVGTFFSSKPIGSFSIPGEDFLNIDVSDWVQGHMAFKNNATRFLSDSESAP